VDVRRAKHKRGEAEVVDACRQIARLVCGAWVVNSEPDHFGDADRAGVRVKRKRSAVVQADGAEEEEKRLTRRELLVEVRNSALAALATARRPLRKEELVDWTLLGVHDLFRDAVAGVADAFTAEGGDTLYWPKFTPPHASIRLQEAVVEQELQGWVVVGERARQILERHLGVSAEAKADASKAVSASDRRERHYVKMLQRLAVASLELRAADAGQEGRSYMSAGATLALGKLNKEDACMVLRRVFRQKGTSKKKAEEVKKLLLNKFNDAPHLLWTEFAVKLKDVGKVVV